MKFRIVKTESAHEGVRYYVERLHTNRFFGLLKDRWEWETFKLTLEDAEKWISEFSLGPRTTVVKEIEVAGN
jgi:hypothetical protein